MHDSRRTAQQANPADTRLLRGPALKRLGQVKSRGVSLAAGRSLGTAPSVAAANLPRDGGAASRAQLISRSLARLNVRAMEVADVPVV